MITGAHSIIYSKDPEADRNFFRDVLKLTKVDVGQGWLIFGLPPAEVAVHPGEKNDEHEFYLMCDDVNAFVAEMKSEEHFVRRSAGHGLGRAHSADPSRRRQARGLPATTYAAGTDELIPL